MIPIATTTPLSADGTPLPPLPPSPPPTQPYGIGSMQDEAYNASMQVLLPGDMDAALSLKMLKLALPQVRVITYTLYPIPYTL